MENFYEYWIVIACFIAAVFTNGQVRLSTIDKKLNILMAAANVDWAPFFDQTMNDQILNGEHNKAAVALRKKTGLSLDQSLAIVYQRSKYLSNQA